MFEVDVAHVAAQAIIRCFPRYLAREVHRTLRADLRAFHELAGLWEHLTPTLEPAHSF